MFEEYSTVVSFTSINISKMINSYNFIGGDIKRMFYPLYLFQIIFISPKYILCNNLITPLGKNVRILVLLFLKSLLVLMCYEVLYGSTAIFYKLYHHFILYTYCCCFYVYYAIIIIAVVVLNILNSRKHVSLIMRIQLVHTTVNLDEKYIQSFIFWNWISNFTFVCVNILFFINFYVSYEYYDFINSVLDVIVIIFDLNIIYGIRILTLLNIYLMEWKKKVSENQENDRYCKKMFEAYKNILASYKLYGKVFEPWVGIIIKLHQSFGVNMFYFYLLLFSVLFRFACTRSVHFAGRFFILQYC